MTKIDTLITGGLIVDGTGLPAFYGDVAIADGRIVAVGNVDAADAADVINATGKIVAPGYVTSHAHYDATIFWDPYISCAGESGVTTVVNSNCGFGFAPVRSEDRERTMMMLSTTEQIPVEAQRTALSWDWNTFDEWLDRIRATPKGVNVMTYLPLNPVLVYVMGVDDAKTRRPTADEIAEMHQIINHAMDAGAIGISMSCMGAEGNSHVDYDGSPMPSDVLHPDDVVEICRALADRGEGVVQILSQIYTFGDRTITERIAEALRGTGARVCHNTFQSSSRFPEMIVSDLEWLDGLRARGLDVTVPCRVNRAWVEASVTELDTFLGYLDGVRRITAASAEGRDQLVALLQDDEFVTAFAREYEETGPTSGAAGMENQTIVGVGDNPDLAHCVGKTLGEVANERGVDTISAMVALVLESDLDLQMRSDFISALDPSQAVLAMRNPAIIPSGSDGGAHTKSFDHGNFQHDLLIWLVREERLMSLEEMHSNLSLKHARCVDLVDRGAILPGYWADLLVYELDNLYTDIERYQIVHDLPDGDWRRKGTGGGYDYILVNGIITHHNDERSGAHPGELLRVTRESAHLEPVGTS